MTSSRTYRKTHPWLTFSADFSRVSHKLWIMLGECQSKCEHIARVPLRPSTADQLYRVYLAKGVLATTAIEGNTLTEEEVLQHLEGKLKLPPSRQYLSREIDNIVDGCNRIVQQIESGDMPKVNSRQIKQLNRTVLAGLELEENVVPGEYRAYSVVAGRYSGAPAKDCEYLVGRLCEWLDDKSFSGGDSFQISFALLKAVLAHLYLAWIHPFGDGNGRTARLLEFQILISSGIPAASAHLLSNHYNLTRSEYYRQLDRASKSGGDILPFVTYAVEGFLDGLRQQLNLIREQQFDISWRNYVHEFFKDKTSASAVRRRHLVLDLSTQPKEIPLSEMSTITPRIARAYATCTERTLIRDLNYLCNSGLVEKTKRGYRARRELILAFQPTTAVANPDYS